MKGNNDGDVDGGVTSSCLFEDANAQKDSRSNKQDRQKERTRPRCLRFKTVIVQIE
jgi:hypothetical protein